MRIIRFDSVGGASGDMILSTLIGLGIDPADLEQELASVVSDPFHIRIEQVSSCGISGLRTTVEIPGQKECCNAEAEETESETGHHSHHHTDQEQGEHHHHHHHHGGGTGHTHRTFADIRKMIEDSRLSSEVKRDSTAIFKALAEAEGKIHGKDPEEVHFHEVGAVDSIVDIVGAVIGFHRLGVDAIAVSPIPVGYGTVKCAHGICPVPAPATAELLRRFQVPTSLDGEECEMLTPTGAVILGWFPKADPSLLQTAQVVRTAEGMGEREMQNRPNLLRAMLCEISKPGAGSETTETLLRFDANIDDVSGEITAFAADKLFKAGALDVWFTPIQMKKGRSAVMISVLLPVQKREQLLEILFRETGTFGVREERVFRTALERRFEQVMTAGGPVSIKVGLYRGEEILAAPEFDDCARSAEKSNRPILEIYREAVSEYQTEKPAAGKKTGVINERK